MISDEGKNMARPLAMKRSISLGLLCACLWATGLSVALVQPAAAQVVKGLPDFTELVEQVGPSVVNIRTLEKSLTTPMHHVSSVVVSLKRLSPEVWARASSCRQMAL
jgi:S1-C subfamily serine protease